VDVLKRLTAEERRNSRLKGEAIPSQDEDPEEVEDEA
jgi:hypothetical protein